MSCLAIVWPISYIKMPNWMNSQDWEASDLSGSLSQLADLNRLISSILSSLEEHEMVESIKSNSSENLSSF